MPERPDPLAEPEGYGQPARPAAGPVTHSITCVLQGCILPASCCLYLGDVNEHIAHLCLCATDAASTSGCCCPAPSAGSN